VAVIDELGVRHWPAVWRCREKVTASRRLFEFNYTNWL